MVFRDGSMGEGGYGLINGFNFFLFSGMDVRLGFAAATFSIKKTPRRSVPAAHV